MDASAEAWKESIVTLPLLAQEPPTSTLDICYFEGADGCNLFIRLPVAKLIDELRGAFDREELGGGDVERVCELWRHMERSMITELPMFARAAE